MNEKDLAKLKMGAEVYQAVFDDPEFAIQILGNMIDGLRDYEATVRKKHSQIDLVVRNIKPEHIKEIRELVIPEVFTNLGFDSFLEPDKV